MTFKKGQSGNPAGRPSKKKAEAKRIAAVGANRTTYTRSWLYPKQAEAIYCPERYAIVEASTKSGKTAGCISWILDEAFDKSAIYWWISPTLRQSRIAFRRIRRAFKGSLAANATELTITLPNESIIHFLTGEEPDNLYGEDVSACVMDEATRMREEAFHAVRSTLTHTRGPLRIIGNVHGRKNWAYRLARKAESGDHAGYHYAKLTSLDAIEGGILDPEELEDARTALPYEIFQELYLAEPTEDGNNPFGIPAIGNCTVPLGPGPAVVWGWDLARGKKVGADWTVGVALNEARQVCGFDRFQGPWVTQVQHIQWLTGTTPALVDATGLGDPIVEALQFAAGNYEGFTFTTLSKQQVMEELALTIQQQLIGVPEGPITTELESFEYELTRTGVRYSAPGGLHDDCVCALALANHHFSVGGPPRLRYLGG